MKRKHRRRVMFWWRVLLIILGFVLAGTLGLRYFESLAQRIPVLFVFWLSFVVAALTAVDKIFGLVRAKVEEGRERATVRVQAAAMSLLVDLAELTQVNIKHLGFSVFAVRRKSLVRVFRFRLDAYPRPTPVRWERGKGAVGECWDTGRTVHRDWREQLEAQGPNGLSEDEFDALGDLADGFTFKEYLGISNKYSEVLAVQVTSEAGAILGVISVDVAKDAAQPTNVLDMDDVESKVTATGELVAADLELMDELE